MSGTTDPRAEYEARARSARTKSAEWSARSDRLANRRGLIFVAGVTAFVVSRTLPALALPAGLAALALAAFFVRLVVLHARARFQVRWYDEVETIHRHALARLDRRWAELDEPEVTPPNAHPFSDDLDVLGHASLMSLVGSSATRPGLDTLREWLLTPAPPEAIAPRQRAVRELADALDFREALWARARLAGPVSAEELRRLLEWAEEPGWSLERRSVGLAGLLLPPLTAAAILAHVFAWVPYVWIATLGVSAWFNRRLGPLVLRDFVRISMGERGLRRYAEIVDQAAQGEFDAPVLRTLRGGLTEGDTRPSDALRRLFRVTELADARHNFFHPALNLLFHWDIHVVRALDGWRRGHGRDLRRWLDALGELDALAAIAGLAHAHPDWAFPAFHDEPVLRTERMGHPLIAPAACVPNDVTVGPPGTFLLVTGSNMSGKSTLLRAIGANVVLAGAGGPVCAGSMTLPPVEIRASMRFRDDLDEGLSYFMAGLKRLKTVVESARTAASARPVLYLLDEILQGTNTAERQIAARGVIRELLECHAIGAVTTHDLSLADVDDLRRRADEVHFRDLPGDADQPLRFDYRLQPGIATSTNALKLMELMGLGVQGGDAPA